MITVRTLNHFENDIYTHQYLELMKSNDSRENSTWQSFDGRLLVTTYTKSIGGSNGFLRWLKILTYLVRPGSE